MSRFSTPDEIFGPVSISKLKDGDTYERAVDGYLPTADVVFLDEIWKAGPAIQNSLLTALNEKIFRNGRQDIALPLKAVIAASNELPAEGEGLEALWDRFLVRYVVEPIRDKGNFLTLLAGTGPAVPEVPAGLQFTYDEAAQLLLDRDGVEIPGEILEFLYALRSRYALRAQERLRDRAAGEGGTGGAEEDDENDVPYVSDRRWKKIAGILRSSALLNGRDAVDWSDCLLLEHLLWDRDSQLGMVRDDIATLLVTALLKGSTTPVGGDGRWRKAPAGSDAPKRFWSPDGGVHYGFEAGGETLLISAADYAKLGQARLNGRFGEGGTVVLTDGPGEFTIRSPKPGTLVIGSFSYPLRLESSAVPSGKGFLQGVMSSTNDRIAAFSAMVERNLFVRPLSGYETLGRELRRYQSCLSAVTAAR